MFIIFTANVVLISQHERQGAQIISILPTRLLYTSYGIHLPAGLPAFYRR